MPISSLYDDYYVYDERTNSLYGTSRHKKYGIGDKVKIIVLSASKDTKKIDFGLIETKKAKPKSSRDSYSRHSNDRDRSRKNKGKQHGKRRR